MRLFALLLLALLALPAYAQTDMKAQTILFAGYQKYKTFQNIRLNFTYRSENKEYALKQEYTGEGFVQGLNHRIFYPEYEVLTDGTNIWTYYKHRKNVNITLYDPKDGMLTPEEIFREDFLQSGLSYKYVGENTDDIKAGLPKADIIEFTPKDNKRTYMKFRVWIDQDTKLMSRWVIWLRNGTITSYDVKITPNVKLDNKFFNFDTSKLPTDVKITDRRKK